MKLLTLNFLTCSITACKSSPLSFPLRPRDAELEQTEIEYDGGLFLRGVLGRLEWEAMCAVLVELGLPQPPDPSPLLTSTSDSATQPTTVTTDDSAQGATPLPPSEQDQETQLRQLHTLLLETQMVSGKLVCGNCGHEYAVKEGIANFLLPAHLV